MAGEGRLERPAQAQKQMDVNLKKKDLSGTQLELLILYPLMGFQLKKMKIKANLDAQFAIMK